MSASLSLNLCVNKVLVVVAHRIYCIAVKYLKSPNSLVYLRMLEGRVCGDCGSNGFKLKMTITEA